MWIIIRLLIGIAILITFEVYFIKKSGLSIKILFPGFYQKKYRPIRNLFIIFLNLFPVALVIIYIYFAITGAYVSAPDNFLIDYLVIYPFWVLFILLVQVSIYLLIIDFLKLLIFPLYKKHKQYLLHKQSIIVFILISFFLIYIPARIIYDYNTISVREINFVKKGLPSQLNGFKIAFIADIQLDHYTEDGRTERFIQEVNNLNPDLILIAGDLITTGPDYITKSGEMVGKLKAKYGVYSCVGDHDNWAYRNDYQRSLSEVKNSLLKNNVEMVDNDERTINIDRAEIGITFITNTYVSRVSEIVLDSLASGNDSDFKIFLAHQPRNYLIDAARKNHFDLYLAGHTHGGQITLLFPFIQLTPTLIETNYIKGDFLFDGMMLIVTRGWGMSLAPVRYNSTPEITLINLTSGSS